MGRNPVCTYCSQDVYKLLYSFDLYRDIYIENMLYCPHCNIVYLDIRTIKTLREEPGFMISLPSYNESFKKEERCRFCRKKKRVPFYRKTDRETKKRSKEYVYQIRVCRQCLLVTLVPEGTLLENFAFKIEIIL